MAIKSRSGPIATAQVASKDAAPFFGGPIGPASDAADSAVQRSRDLSYSSELSGRIPTLVRVYSSHPVEAFPSDGDRCRDAWVARGAKIAD